MYYFFVVPWAEELNVYDFLYVLYAIRWAF
jgi:hypothetical protein